MNLRKLLSSAAIAAVLVGGSLAAAPAMAQRYAGHYGYYHGGYYGYHGGFYGPAFGVYIGPGFFPGDYFGYAPYYYPPAVLEVPVAPATYVEQSSAAPAPQQGYWYRCDSAKGAYYPYVKDCPGGWEKVTPTPQ